MSLAINVVTVTAVLLPDGWHDIRPGSFYIDSYEYIEERPDHPDRDPFVYLGGGQCRHVASTGFGFTDNTGAKISGPLTSILAVRNQPDTKSTAR